MDIIVNMCKDRKLILLIIIKKKKYTIDPKLVGSHRCRPRRAISGGGVDFKTRAGKFKEKCSIFSI